MSNKIQFKRGIKANLPTLNVGEPAFTTDTNEFFIGNGINNIEFAKKSDIQQLCINIKDYGAIGDGLTDNTTIIQNLLNEYAGKTKILIPFGTFVTQSLTIPSNTHLQIKGILKLKNNTNGQLISFINGQNIVIDGLRFGIIDGNGTNQITNSELACIYSGLDSINDNIIIKNIHIKNAKTWNINMIGKNCSIIDSIISDCPNMSFFTKGSDNCLWRNCLSYNISNDYSIGFYGGVTNSIIDGCIAYNNTTNGLAAIAVINDSGQTTPNKNILVTNCIAYNNKSSGFAVWGVDSYEEEITFNNCIAYNNNLQNLGTAGGFLVIKAKNVSISNCKSYANGIGSEGSCGIFFTDVFNLNIGNNTIYNEGQGSTLGFGILGNGNNVTIHNNLIYDDQITHTLTKGIQMQNGCENVDIVGNSFKNIISTIYLVNPSQIRSVKDNGNHNPIGWITSPTVPASSTYYSNSTPYTYTVTIYGGDVQTIIIDNKNIGLTSGTFMIHPYKNIRIDYTVAPNWIWYGI